MKKPDNVFMLIPSEEFDPIEARLIHCLESLKDSYYSCEDDSMEDLIPMIEFLDQALVYWHYLKFPVVEK